MKLLEKLKERLYQKDILEARKGSKFIVTSPDANVPSERGLELGPGSLAAPIEYATKRKPIYIGKPYSPMIYSALNKINVKPENAAIIGDTIESDIQAKFLSNFL